MFSAVNNRETVVLTLFNLTIISVIEINADYAHRKRFETI